MEKYVIYKIEGTSSKKFLSTIYRNSTSHSNYIGDSIEFVDKNTALKICDYLNERETEKYKVMCIKTTIEEDVQWN